ncbi:MULTISPECIES: hypothetical protein [Caballeronia]|jgi:hypothetical protein|uniref:Uncharacterized protein n=1 Tax=Caballeronia zhejiangensis TaxID=871203 RepID=A0A656QJC0_9BURK|nr:MULTISPECIES: hypothetical protein [Caballeronia]EKS67217.1 hypothetical protein BURK_035264 [Burkholderia sp. SJ98]KDR27728.1 hypothetical protein BG60_16355 [Caballeronia zhejiangensis]MCG7405674.1 hypothetical protein [Caballeronia zhejiangensis]MCI1047208.1 hypothetical protein [Caballeronia zhejiangensis]MDR5769274.1 hypothetical protein [Caballeronia sp. LZ028]
MSINILVVAFLLAAAVMLCCSIVEYVAVLRIIRDDAPLPQTPRGPLAKSDRFFCLSALLCFVSLACLLLVD